MRDKRPVDELSVEELERILAIKRREERQQRLQRMQKSGRVIDLPEAEMPSAANDSAPAAEAVLPPPPAHDPVAAALASLTQPVQAAVQREVYHPYENGNAAPSFDENAGAVSPAEVKAGKRKRRKVVDRLLLLVEVAAVIAIAGIGINLIQAIGKLDTETALAQQQADEMRRQTIPTLVPTPTIRLAQDVVLPGGHIITATGAVQFNYGEVPSHLVPLVHSQWVQPVINRPPPTSETARTLIIPRLNLNSTIVQGWDEEALKQGVGQSLNGINPADDVGNVAFAAHNDIYGKLFEHLDQLQIGDTFQVQTNTAVYTYSVTETHIVDPTDVSVLANRRGATATLISCYPYQVNTHRYVVFADRIS